MNNYANNAATLEGGFLSPSVDASHAFRNVMQAMARPGTIRTLKGAAPPSPLSVAAGVCVLTLCDNETPIYLAGDHNCSDLREWIAFHTGAPITSPSEATFAIGTWEALQPLSIFKMGNAEYPDRSATLITELGSLSADGATLTGPGIKHSTTLSLPSKHAFQENHQHYPLGLDFIFTCVDQVAALPRSVEVL